MVIVVAARGVVVSPEAAVLVLRIGPCRRTLRVLVVRTAAEAEAEPGATAVSATSANFVHRGRRGLGRIDQPPGGFLYGHEILEHSVQWVLLWKHLAKAFKYMGLACFQPGYGVAVATCLEHEPSVRYQFCGAFGDAQERQAVLYRQNNSPVRHQVV